MAYAQELKNLVAEIKTGHKDRTARIGEIKEETHDLIAQYQRELKEMAIDLKDFLAKSEETRKKDFNAMMGKIRARVKDIKGNTADLLAKFDKEMKELAADLKDFLKKSETTRMADFKAMMKNITADIGAIRRSVSDLLVGYKAERKEAAGYWAGLRGRGEAAAPEAPVTPKPAPKAKRRKARRKKK